MDGMQVCYQAVSCPFLSHLTLPKRMPSPALPGGVMGPALCKLYGLSKGVFWGSCTFCSIPSTIFVPKVLFVEDNVQKLFLYTAGYETRYISTTGIF